MSKYTTEVRYIVENASGLGASVGYASVNELIKASLNKIFDFDFPIFDEAYRSVLETKILKHYYTREIGLETVGLWKLKLDTRLNEIMPYYNQLYKSQLLEFNPFYDVDITRTRKGKNEGTRKETANGNGKQEINGNTTTKDRYSDTPQGALTGLENDEYMSSARLVDDNNSSNSKTDYNSSSNSVLQNTDEYLETVKGKQGTKDYSSLLMIYRETFLNIDMQIIDELSDLFMNIW